MNGDDGLRMLLLGAPQFRLDGADITSQIGDKPLAVAAYLAMAAFSRVPRSKLATTFWSDKTDEASRYRLRHALWELRRCLGKERLRADDASCWLEAGAPTQLDVREFENGCQRQLGQHSAALLGDELERFRTLLELYRGELLEGIVVREAPLFEEWLLVERERLELLYLDALWCLATAQMEAENTQGAERSLKRLIDIDPLRERGYRLMMELRLRQGDKNAALKVYRLCADRLAAELGVTPSAETQLLRDSIARGNSLTAEAHLQRAILHASKGRHKEALLACTAAESRRPDPIVTTQIALLRAEIAGAEGRQGESLRLIQMARETIARLMPR